MIRTLLLSLALMGCGRTALGHSYETLGMGHMAHNETVAFVRAQIAEGFNAQCGDLEAVERLECGQALAEDFRAREAAIHASADTVDILAFAVLSWARSVAAGEADKESPPLAVCEALSRLVSTIDSWATVGGEDLPIEPWSCPDYEPSAAEDPQ